MTDTALDDLLSTSERFCKDDALVSAEFLASLEQIADSNADGALSSVEFDEARDPTRVTVSPGCPLREDVAFVFPNIPRSELTPCARHRHASFSNKRSVSK